MNLQLTKKNMMLVLIVLVALAFLAGGYFYFLFPLNSEIKRLENELATEEKLYDALAVQVADTKNDAIENSMLLQKKLPVESLIEQFLLDLEKAEVVSNSLIEDMSFQDNTVSANDAIIVEPKVEQEQTAGDEQGTESVENETTETEEPAVPAMPEGIKRVTVNLTVTSENYFDMYKFLETIENLERITKIDSLSVTGGEEILSVDQEIKELTYKVVLSTFYYPALEDLRGELPIFETPPPSNKENPLATGMYFNDSEGKSTSQKDEKATEEKGTSSGDIQTYTVQKGDTLYDISLRLLNANRVSEIKQLNNLKSDAIFVGQEIKLPKE